MFYIEMHCLYRKYWNDFDNSW